MKYKMIISLLSAIVLLLVAACNSDSVLPKNELGIRFQSDLIQLNDGEDLPIYPQREDVWPFIRLNDPVSPDSTWLIYVSSFEMEDFIQDSHAYGMVLHFYKKVLLTDVEDDPVSGEIVYKDTEKFWEEFLDKDNFTNETIKIKAYFLRTYQWGFAEFSGNDFNQISIKKVKRVSTDDGDRLQIEGEFQCKFLTPLYDPTDWFTMKDGTFRVQLEE